MFSQCDNTTSTTSQYTVLLYIYLYIYIFQVYCQMVKSPTYWTHQGKCIFKGSVSRDLCKNTLACLSEAQMGSNHEKIEVKIS